MKGNYRSANILPVLLKMFEKIVFNQIYGNFRAFLTNNNVDFPTMSTETVEKMEKFS